MSAPPMLSPDQVRFFHENGYLLIEDALSAETVATLKERTRTLLEEFSLEGHPMTRFDTGKEGAKHVGDEYFLTSGDKVRFFFEPDAFDAAGKLTRPKEKSINKIGHGLHERDDAFRSMTLTPQNLSIALSLGFTDPLVLQSMIICKQPEIGGEVGPHQDSPFLFTNPPSAMGFWYALEDCTVTNGCLSFIPGSHRYSPVTKRLVRLNGGADGTGFVDIPAINAKDVGEGVPPPSGGQGEYTVAEVKAGTLVVIHGSVLHKSERNTSDRSRWIYTFHMIEGGEGYAYDELNWLQPTGEGFSRLRDAVVGQMLYLSSRAGAWLSPGMLHFAVAATLRCGRVRKKFNRPEHNFFLDIKSQNLNLPPPLHTVTTTSTSQPAAATGDSYAARKRRTHPPTRSPNALRNDASRARTTPATTHIPQSMLHKVAAPARRSFTWICSDCRRGLGGYRAGQAVAVNANCRSLSILSNLAARATAQQQIWRGRLPSSAAATSVYTRYYSSDVRTSDDGGEPNADDQRTVETREEQVEDILSDGELESFANSLSATYNMDNYNFGNTVQPVGDPPEPQSQAQKQTPAAAKKPRKQARPAPAEYQSKFNKGPMTREVLARELDEINYRLEQAGYRLIDPSTPAPQSRVVTRNKKPTKGHSESIWQKFKRDYIERYRAGDPAILNGRAPGWKPSVAELKVEYVKYFWDRKREARRALAERTHWRSTPDLRRRFANTLVTLERQTSKETIEKYGYDTEGKQRKVVQPDGESNEMLHQLVEEWQEPLQKLEPDAYSFVEPPEQEQEQPADETDGLQRRSLMLPRELDEFRMSYMQNIDVDDLAAKFKVKLTSFPASGSELLALIQAMSLERISKQDLRYILPPEYSDSVEFISQTMASLIISHEGSNVLNTAIFNIAINYMMKYNQVKKGRLLMDYMDHLRIRMNLGTWREALRTAAKAKDIFVFNSIVERMVTRGVELNDEVWRAFLDCAHTPGQQVQILDAMKRTGINPKFLAPAHLLRLAFQMYDDQRRLGNADAKIPWQHFAGMPLRAETLNAILRFLFDNHLLNEARDIMNKALTVQNVHPDYETLRLLVRFHGAHGRPIEMAKAIHLFATTYDMHCKADLMEAMFRAAHSTRYYNVVRTVWAHACLTNRVTAGMIDRMRHDIYETGQQAGKAGKLALGVCSEAAEAVVKTPIWAMRLVSDARDKFGYLVSEGGMYSSPATMTDVKNLSDAEVQTVRERRATMHEFRENSIEMRKQLMRSDMVAHRHWQPRREFSVDLIRAFRYDRRIRREQPESRKWTPLEWAWHMYQVRRVDRRVDARIVRGLDWLRVQTANARRQGNTAREERLQTKMDTLLDKLPEDFGSAFRNDMRERDAAERARAPRRTTAADAGDNDGEEGDSEQQAGKNPSALHDHILDADIDGPVFAYLDEDEPKLTPS
ncbi:hypothetical protein Dda_7695 [Drechslerella dactyloides]|uniref:Phytanoyl-CoA dioxygenase n=1 Tax=Drechslerella dactyloides TaxID=74499 RepID=A0AAD6NGX6_DREDA|nr:hypothetical protein Dda_7695 [Drechslerella dactyloides]